MDTGNFEAIASHSTFAGVEVCPWSSGDIVIELQELLNAHGYQLRIDGDFGSVTETAIRDYQHQHHLRVDGVVGAKTWISLRSTIQPGTRLLQYDRVGADVFELQGLLLIQGYEVQRNGVFDFVTRDAVIHFQERHQLQPTGIVDRTTWMVIRGKTPLPKPPQQTGWIWNARQWR